MLGLEWFKRRRAGIVRQKGVHLGLKGTYEVENKVKPRELDNNLLPFLRLWGRNSPKYITLHDAYVTMRDAGALTPREYRDFQKKRS